MSKLQLGDWGEASIRGALQDLGWSIAPGNACRVVTGLETGDGTLTRAEDEKAPSEFVRLSLPIGANADFPAILAAATDSLGHAPPLMGGPAPWVRWRRPSKGASDVGTSIGLVRTTEAVQLELIATDTWEDWACFWFEWGEGVEELPYRWLTMRRHPSLAGMTTGGRVVQNWPTIERGLALTFDALLDGVDALTAPDEKKPESSFRLTHDARTIGTHFDVILAPGRKLRLLKSNYHGLEALGWEQLKARTWGRSWDRATAADCATAAALAAATLRQMRIGTGPDGIAEPPWYKQPAYTKTKILGQKIVDLPGFGFSRSTSNR